MPTVAHFEIPADRPGRAKEFYKNMFGWKFDNMDSENWMIRTGEHESIIGGSITKRRMKGQGPVNYVTVKSIARMLNKAEKIGAKVITPKTAIPKMGYLAIITDSEKNPVGLWENNPKAM